MEHSEIRFKILNLLYQKYYEEPGRPQNTDKIIEEAELAPLMNDVTGDILYLLNKGLIDDWKSKALGRVLPLALIITPYGIDIVESVLDQAINQSTKQNSAPNVKEDVNKLSSIVSPTQKYKEFLNLAKLHMDVFMPIITNIFRSLST